MKESKKSDNLDPSLSRRLYRALTVDEEGLYQVIGDPSMEVLETALKNPAFNENHLLTLLKRRDLSENLLRTISRLSMVGENHKLKLAVVKNPGTPSHVNLAILPQLNLFELVDICHLPGVTPDQKMAAERAIIQRLPLIPLGNKITLARRSTATVVEALIREGDPRFLDACLENPQLKEGAIFRFINGPNTTAEGISMVARHPRWKNRLNLQLAILKNPKTPEIWFNLYLPHLSHNDLKSILSAKSLKHNQKALVNEELKRRGL